MFQKKTRCLFADFADVLTLPRRRLNARAFLREESVKTVIDKGEFRGVAQMTKESKAVWIRKSPTGCGVDADGHSPHAPAAGDPSQAR